MLEVFTEKKESTLEFVDIYIYMERVYLKFSVQSL